MILAVFIPFQTYAYDFNQDGIYYNILSEEDQTLEVTFPYDEIEDLIDKGNTYEREIIIPTRVLHNHKTYKVVAISMYTFWGSDELTSVSIPASVTEIGVDAFGNCENLSHIDVDNDNTVYTSDDGILYDKNMHTLIRCPQSGKFNVDIPASVAVIGDGAFRDCPLNRITIPNSVTKISDCAFYGCSHMKSIDIPISVVEIGVNAFTSCIALTTVSIPNSISEIAFAMFQNCISLENISIPTTVTEIKGYAFNGCKRLNDISIPNSVTKICWGAFQLCEGMTSVTIGNSVKEIENYAFGSCTALTTIYCKMDEPVSCTPDFPDNVLMDCILYVPVGTKGKYETTTPWRDFWNIVEMDFSGVDEVAEDGGDAVRVENGRIVTEGDALTEVLDLQGRTVYRGYDRVIDNLPAGLYVVRSGNNTVKIKL